MTRPDKTRVWVVNQRPYGQPVLEGDDSTFALVEQDLPALKPNQVLVKVEYFGNAPAQREWIEPTFESRGLYRPPITEGQKMGARGMGIVIESTSQKFSNDQWIRAATGWTEYVILDDRDPDLVNAPTLPNGLSRTHYLGVLGSTGLSAYYGYVVVGDAKAGETVLVSGAAGATGSMVIQIAKRIVGAKRVIGIAGTDEKCRWVESLGADKCLNYRSQTFLDDLVQETPNGVDLYYDNIGGEILDQALLRMNLHGKIVACGAMSGYNSGNSWTSKNYYQIILMRLSIKGFILSDFLDRAAEVISLYIKAIAEGVLIVNDKNETVVDTKFEKVPHTWMLIFEGGNTGKLVTKLV